MPQTLNRVSFNQIRTKLTVHVFKEYILFHYSVSEISEEETDNPGRDNAFVSNMPSLFNTSFLISISI